jgi:hypothetical protein
MLLDHVRSLTDKLLVLETEKAALIVANATISRDVAEIKRALTSRTLRVSAAGFVKLSETWCLFLDLKPVSGEDLPALLQSLSAVVAENGKCLMVQYHPPPDVSCVAIQSLQRN